ncbi:autotransporter outer membrane beta-barrel domain-containing protein, partial [Achromobacter aegrifaciens]
MKCAEHENVPPIFQSPNLAARVAIGLAAALSGSATLAEIIPQGTYTTPFRVVTGEEKTFVGGTVITPIPPYPPPLGGTGIQVQGGLAILDPSLGDGTPIRISVNGNAIDGLYVRSGGQLIVRPGGVYVYATGGSVRGIYNVGSTGLPSQFDGSNVYVTTDFADSHALRTYGADATTILRDSTLTTLQNGSKGAEVWQGAKANLYNTAILTKGTTAYGAHVLQNGSELTATNGSITTEGTTAYGVLVQDYGKFMGTGTSVRAQNAIGVYVFTNGIFQSDGMTIQSDRTYGMYVNGGTATLKDTQVSTLAAGSFALFVNGGPPATVDGGQILTFADRSVAVRTQSGAVANINGTRVSTLGLAAHGIHVEGWGTVNLGRDGDTGTLVDTQGADADAVRVSVNATRFSATGATLQTAGANAQGLHLTGTAGAAAKTYTLVDSRISSAQADGIHLSEGPAIVSLTGSSVTGGNAAINIGATAAATADIGASGTLIQGRVLTQPGSTTNLSMSNDSTWQVTGNSNLTNLVNTDSLIDFTAPQAGSYKTVTTRNYGGNGTIALNTYLGDDSSPSDKLIVNGGSATGTSQLRIKNTGGPGALTTASGIQVVEVVNGGVSGAGAFALSGRAVAGPYEYRLYQGSAAAPTDQSWYLRSEKEAPPPPPPPPPPP